MEKLPTHSYHRSSFIPLIFFLLMFSKQLFAQTDTDTNLWSNMSYYAEKSDSKWGYLINPQVRFIDNRYKLQQVNLFAGLGYQVKDDLQLLFGVFRNYIKEDTGTVSGENRVWQQASGMLLQRKAFDVASRSRLEERIRNGTNSYANRFRQLFSLEIPFVKSSQLIIGNESFLQLNKPDWVSQRTYAQNRFNVGVRGKLGEMVFEMGYLNQYIFNNINQMANILYVSIAYSKKYSPTMRDVLLDN